MSAAPSVNSRSSSSSSSSSSSDSSRSLGQVQVQEQEPVLSANNSKVFDPDDDAKSDEMMAWLIQEVETTPSLAKLYCNNLVAKGISTIKRLGRQVDRDESFLVSLGVSRDNGDEEEIIGKYTIYMIMLYIYDKSTFWCFCFLQFYAMNRFINGIKQSVIICMPIA